MEEKQQIPLFKVYMSPEVGAKVDQTLYSNYIGQGPRVDEFEALLRKKFESNYVATVNSATSGLHLLYHINGQDGDEVLTTALTCTASNWGIPANRKKINWVDVDGSCNMDLVDLERKISPKTKIILLVHWGGNPIDLDEVERIRLKCFDLYGFHPVIIQDCAHAYGSTFNNKPLACYYNAVYSFQAIKTLTSGDGGAVVVRNEELYRKIRLLRWFGIDRDANRTDFRCEADIKVGYGFKFHMNDINATIGINNIPGADFVVGQSSLNATYYDVELQNVPGVTVIKKSPKSFSSQWIHTIHVERRDDFMRYMNEHGIMVSRVHERNDRHSCMKEFVKPLPGLDKVIKTMVCIPNGFWVTPNDREFIVSKIKQGW